MAPCARSASAPTLSHHRCLRGADGGARRPWYAFAPRVVPGGTGSIGTIGGPVDGLAAGMQRWITERAQGTSGWDALGTWGNVLAGVGGG